MFTYHQLSTGGVLNAYHEEFNISLRHNGAIRCGDAAIGALVASHCEVLWV
jgi:hypothetical protein